MSDPIALKALKQGKSAQAKAELATICPDLLTDPDVKIYYDPDKTEIGEVEFKDNDDIEVAYFPNVETIGQNAFWGAKKLRAVIFPKATDMGKASMRSATLEIAIFPKAKTITNIAFQRCYALREIYFPEATEIVAMSNFASCTALRKVNLPKVAEIRDGGGFDGCSALAEVCVPLLRLVGPNAFANCSSLKKLDLPSVEKIETMAFRTAGIETLILRNQTLCTLNSIGAFTLTPIASGAGYIYVPSALIENYKAATNWSTYAAQFRSIEDYPEICDPDWDGHRGDVVIPSGKSLTLEAGATVNDEAGVLGGGGAVSWNDLTDKPFGDFTMWNTSFENATFETGTSMGQGWYYYDVDSGESWSGFEYADYKLVFNGEEYYAHANGSETRLVFRFLQVKADGAGKYRVMNPNGDGAAVISLYQGEVKRISTVYIKTAEAVADAAGDTPTAAEFNALLSSLRAAGLLST